jgi:hypothetical protein
MSTRPIAPTGDKVQIEPTRNRQTERPRTPFREALAGSVNVLMSGAEVATHVVAGPLMAAAVHEVRTEAVAGISRSGGVSTPIGTAPVAGGPGGADSGGFANAQSLQRESQAFSLQLLALQEEVQQENRHFSTMSNLLRARHDTAKAAISNIRS